MGKRLVNFNESYYRYPIHINRGYFGNYPFKKILDLIDSQEMSVVLRDPQFFKRGKFQDFVCNVFFEESHKTILLQLVRKHGIFSEWFFSNLIRDNVASKYASESISISAILEILAFDNDEYEGLIKQLLSSASSEKGKKRIHSWVINTIVDHLYNHFISEVVSCPVEIKDLQEWYMIYSTPRRCLICSRAFRVIDLPYWIYFGSNGCKDCCFTCPIIERPRKRELLNLLPKFVESCGFIPRSDCSPINNSFTSRLNSEFQIEVYELYGKTGTVEHVKKKFGSWFEALAASQVLPRGTMITARGARCLATDGHICHSLDEKLIDDWFTKNNIMHEKEPFYPTHEELNPHGRMRADWKINDTFIEYFGLVGDAKYDAKCIDKILLAEKSRIRMVPIYPKDLITIDEKLRFLL